MSKLEKSLTQWVSNGFIDKKQADQIYQYELTQPHTSWVISSLLVLGVLVIGLGVISVIAANWEQIPNIIKLIADFSILIVLSMIIVRAWRLKKDTQFEIVLLFFMIFCLASIGLINQIYHTGGELYQALMFWSLITLPVAIAARHVVVPFLWIGGFLVGSACTAFQSPLLQPIIQNDFIAIFITITLFCACLVFFSKKLALEKGFEVAFQIWLFMSGFVTIAIVDQSSNVIPFSFTPYVLSYLFAVVTTLGILQNSEYNKIQKYLLIVTLVAFLFSFHLPVMMIKSSVIHAFFTLFILGLIAIFTASLQKRRLFQWILFFMGLRFLGLYFQALGGLALTGLGLIISGILIIVMTMLWCKYRNTLAIWAERWIR